MLNIGADRATHTVNCKYAYHEDVQDVRAEQNGSHTTKSKKYYDHLLRQGDKVLKRGEVAYTCTDPETIDHDQQPYVRTCLNGKRFRSNEDARNEKQRSDLEKSIRMIGFVKNDIAYTEGGNQFSFPTNMQPVAIVSGKTTVYNTGNRRVEAGKAVKAYLVNPDEKNQYNDANRMSSNRKVVGLETLALHRDLKSEVGAEGKRRLVELVERLDPSVTDAGARVDAALKHASADVLLAAHRAMLMYRARNVVGVALSHASPGGRMDVMLTTLVNPVTYSKIKGAA